MAMEEEELRSIGDYIDIVRRRKWQLIIPALLLFLVAGVTVMVMPSVYRSSATILIEQQEIPQDLVRSTVTSFADQRIQSISQRVMTSANLTRIVEKFNLYKLERSKAGMMPAIELMRKDVKLEMVSADVVDPRSGRPTEATIAFTLSYDNQSPDLAQQVASEVVSLFLEENLRVRQESAKETARFLDEEANKLSEQIDDLETKLAQFKERNAGNLPELNQLNQQMMDRTDREIASVDQRIRDAEERKIYLQAQLSQLNPQGSLYTADGERLLGPEDRLKTLQVQYISMATRYSLDHPDMTKARREMEALKAQLGIQDDTYTLRAQLEAQQGSLSELKKRYSANHPEVIAMQRSVADTEAQLHQANLTKKPSREIVSTAENPAYVQLKSQLDAANTELKSLFGYRDELRTKLQGVEASLLKAPGVEREYSALTRDYDNATIKYREIKAKQLEAGLAQSLENERKGERFSLIESPLVPLEPRKPNRLAILFLGFVLSLGVGAGNVAIRESLDDTIHSSNEGMAVLEIPPIAVVPYINNAQDKADKGKRFILGIALTLLAVAIIAAVVHWLVLPLDVIWYSILRRVGEIAPALLH